MRNERPPIETKMFFVCENLYYIPDRVAPVSEYRVCNAKVTGFYEGGFVEICLLGKMPDMGYVPTRKKLSEIGKTVFYTAREAAELAKKKTEDFDRIWGWCEPPMRRVWEKLLKEGGV